MLHRRKGLVGCPLGSDQIERDVPDLEPLGDRRIRGFAVSEQHRAVSDIAADELEQLLAATPGVDLVQPDPPEPV